MMASSSGQGVAAVMLPRFSTMGDPWRNCEKFIQMFKDWCELNGWYDSEPPPEEPEEGEDPVPVEPSGLQKGKLWQLSVPPLLVTKNSKTFYMAFNYQMKKQRNRTLYSNICRNTSRLAKEF